MARRPRGAVALVSIHPRFANAIMEGSKRVEFRKVPFRREVAHVLIYATSPISRIVGMFEVASIDKASPRELWRKYQRVGGIERNEFFDYFRDRSVGIALCVRIARRLKRPIRLQDLDPSLSAPQSFTYAARVCLDIVARSAFV